MVFFDSEHNLLEIKKIDFSSTHQLGVNQFITPIRKYIKESLKRYSISKIFIVADDTYSFEKFLTLSLNPTDDFIISLKNKIKQNFPDTYSKKSIYYKIETERADHTIEYLLPIITVDPIFQKTIEKKLSILKNIRIQWMPFYYNLNKLNIKTSTDEKDVLAIHIAKNYTDLIVSTGNQIQFVKRISFSLPQIESALSKDHFSQNQLRTVLDLDLDFNNYNNLQRGISFKVLVDDFLKDIKRTIQTYQNSFNRNINEIKIMAEVFKKNNLVELIEREIQIPTHYYESQTVKSEYLLNLSDEDKEVVSGIINADKRGDLFLPIRSMSPGIRHMLKRKISLSFLINNAWKKFLLGLIIVLFVFASANTYCSKLYERSSKNLYSVKNKLAKVKQKYLDSIDASREIEEYKNLISNVDKTQITLKKSSRLLKLIYKKRQNGIKIKNISYDNSQRSFIVYGESVSIEDVNKYLESIGRETTQTELNVDKIEKISAENYQFYVEIKMN